MLSEVITTIMKTILHMNITKIISILTQMIGN